MFRASSRHTIERRPAVRQYDGGPELERSNYIAQIDGLRAIAVLAVVLFHLDKTWLPFGYLGVDVFFVISGFVITRSLGRSEAEPIRSRLLTFFARRVKRLAPALLVCLVVTAVGAAIWIPRAHIYLETGAFASFGLANIHLFREAQNYFGVASALDPFTQTWSLGVEEQFYLFFALLLALAAAWRRASFSMLLAVCAGASLIAYLSLQAAHPGAAFYLFFARIWQFGLGAVLARLQTRPPRALAGPIAFTGLALLAACLLGVAAEPTATFLATLASALVLTAVGVDRWTAPILAARPAVYLGRISYSLYLWHWPVIVLGLWAIGPNGLGPAIALLVMTGLAAASHEWVERPWRYRRWSASALTTIALGLAAMAAVAALLGLLSHPLRGALYIGEPWRHIYVTHGALNCHSPRDKDAQARCLGRMGDAPHVFLIGDSHAANLAPSLRAGAQGAGFQFRYLTDSGLWSDFLGVRSCADPLCHKGALGERLDLLKSLIRPGDLIVFSMSRGRIYAKGRDGSEGLGAPLRDRLTHLQKSLEQALSVARAQGTGLALVHDIPIVCDEKSFILLHARGRLGECGAARAASLKHRRPLDDVFKSLGAQGALLTDPHDQLCPGRLCTALMGDTPLYGDSSPHFARRSEMTLQPLFIDLLRDWRGQGGSAAVSG